MAAKGPEAVKVRVKSILRMATVIYLSGEIRCIIVDSDCFCIQHALLSPADCFWLGRWWSGAGR